MRLLGGIRLSRHRGEEDPSTSPVRQRATIVDLVEQRGDTLVDVAEDLDVSAIKLTPFQRPDIGKWLNERPGEFDGVVWSKLDRAVRSMSDLHELSRWAVEHRKLLIFASGPGGGAMELDFRSGPLAPVTQLLLTVLAFAAEMEAFAIVERNTETRAHMRSIGRWGGGMYPYYLTPVKAASGVGYTLALNPDTEPIAREIVDRVLDGESKNAVARDLTDRGVLSPRDYRRVAKGKERKGYAWSVNNLTEMLTARALMGHAEFDGRPILDPEGNPVVRAEALIDLTTFQRLQRIIEDAAVAHRGKRPTGPAHLLLDIGVCALCGEPMYSRHQPYRSSRQPGAPKVYRDYLGCRSAWGHNRRQSADERCAAASVWRWPTEALAGDVLMDQIGHLEVLTPTVIPGVSWVAEIQQTEEILTDLIQMVAGKSDAVKRIYERQIAEVSLRLETLTAHPETQDRVELTPTGQTYRQMWDGADADVRRKLLIEAGVRVEVAKASPDGSLTVGLFERPEGRNDVAVSTTVRDGVQLAMWLPVDLAERATRQAEPFGRTVALQLAR